MSLEDQFSPNAGDEEVDLGVNLDEVPAQHAVPEGEYLLTLVDAKIMNQKPEKGTGKFIMASLEVANDPDSKLITHVMMLPSHEDKERTQKSRLRNIGDFYKTFKIPASGPVKLSSYLGNQGFGLLKLELDPTYGEQNRISKFVVGK